MFMEYLWEIIVNIIESVLLGWLLFSVLQQRNKIHKYTYFFIYLLIATTVVTLLNFTAFSPALTQLISMAATIIYCLFAFSDSISKKVLYSCVLVFISIFADELAYTCVFILFPNQIASFDFTGDNRFIVTLAYLLFELILVIIFRKLFRNLSYIPAKATSSLLVFTVIMMFLSDFALSVVVEIDSDIIPDKYRFELNLLSIVLLIVYIIVLYFFNILSNIYTRNNILNEQLLLQKKAEESSRQLLNSVNELRGWKHDYQNHLNVLSTLYFEGNYSELGKYIVNQKNSLPPLFSKSNSGNSILDAILTDKILQLSNTDIKFEHTVLLPENFNIDNVDLTIIIGNLLDNAIEACNKVENSNNLFIDFSIMPKLNGVEIITTNSYDKDNLLIKENCYISNKSDSLSHGLGLKQIETTINKYSGFYRTKTEDCKFISEIFIPLT